MRIGIDIGGTFTDFVLAREDGGKVLIGKKLTTPHDPSVAVLEGVAELTSRAGAKPADLDLVIHATTLVTNTVIERTGARVGLITTAGFRDILEIGNELRYDIYDLFLKLPEPLVGRAMRAGVVERTTADGKVYIPIDVTSGRKAIEDLVAGGAESIAICFLHSYANPANEQAMRDLVVSLYPSIPVTASHELMPEIREYERTLATVANAYTQPIIQGYLARLTRGLDELGCKAPVYIMQSSGGLTTALQAASAPVTIVESGPAAGAICAARIGKAIGLDHVIAFDMGGTTAKTCLIREGRPSVSVDLEFARLERFKKGSGFPLRVPSVELIEIGAGGGSIARIDELGLLKVGPRSAGSAPGPACYGRSGREPTVTDADLVLGYLDPDFFLGGEMSLDIAKAAEAIDRVVAKPLDLSLVNAAWGIHEIVNESMALASRIHVVERGEDPRNFTVVAFGGAGPVHAHGVAAKLGVRRILFPVAAGAASALGLLLAQPSADAVRTHIQMLNDAEWDRINRNYAEMTERSLGVLSEIVGDSWTATRTMDLRYAGQGYERNVPTGSAPLSREDVASIAKSFRDASGKQSNILDDAPISIVNLRLTMQGTAASMPPRILVESSSDERRVHPARKAFFGPSYGMLECSVLARYALPPGSSGKGPALVEERESTIVVGPNQNWTVDDLGNFITEFQ